MRSFRSKPVGWRNESYRHYLASKGIKTRYFDRKSLFEAMLRAEAVKKPKSVKELEQDRLRKSEEKFWESFEKSVEDQNALRKQMSRPPTLIEKDVGEKKSDFVRRLMGESIDLQNEVELSEDGWQRLVDVTETLKRRREYTAKKLKGYELAQLRRIRGEKKLDEFDELVSGEVKAKKKVLKTSTGQEIKQVKTDIPEDVQVLLSKTARVKRVKSSLGKREGTFLTPEEQLEELRDAQMQLAVPITDHVRKLDQIKGVTEEKRKLYDRREKARRELEKFLSQFDDEKEV